MSAIRVIGIGNRNRGDDGLGPAVIDALAATLPPDVQLLNAPGDMLALLELWDTPDQVILVDAIAPDGAPGRLVCIDASTSAPSPAAGAFASTHAFNLLEAIELGRVLGRLPARLLIYGIEGEDFRPGAPLSPRVTQALAPLLTSLQTECEECMKRR